ncbi:uncharacterized protein LOC107646515 [Arachis ipaensis]|uniref:uncharacterized protein LOC107646515 n=1 Tax=Arachis ipaensis TaxID=130454 RepID=UPI0007AEF3E3|nr:uncharacterized protein LOC107646515 [Arachis ipaensis]
MVAMMGRGVGGLGSGNRVAVAAGRTDNGRTVKKRECVLDNKFIVSYNPELLLKFRCHINVEYTCQTSSIKYLFKYVHKDNDRVTATLYNAGDLSEATQVVDERAISHKSMFLGWMTANMSYPYTRSLTYAEFPTKFAWKDDSSKWFPRKKGFAIGRLMYQQEASSWASGSYVRRLFVILLTSNNISRPEHVWDRCWHELSDDILYRQRAVMNMRELTMSDDEIKQLCLMDIDKILHSYGKTLKDYPPMPLATEVDSSLLIEMGDFFFVYGHGGTGKTFLCNLMSAEIRSRGDIVLNVAPSGIASLLLPNRRTAHSRFKIPLNITEDSVCNIKPGSPQAMLLLKAKLIIWDEAPMVSRYCYEVPDKCLGDIMRCSPTYSKDLPFGGKVVILGGDFRQILPVILRGSRQDIVHSTVNSSYLWKFCQVLKLTKNMRLSVGTTASDQDETEQFGECGLCNGTRLQVRKFGNHVIECEVLMGNNVGHIALIPRMNMVPTNETVSVRFQ